MTEQDLHDIEKVIGYTFKNIHLLQQAFIRESYSLQDREHQSNISLAWVGEATLYLILKEKIIDKRAKINAFQEFTFDGSFEESDSLLYKFMEESFLSDRIDGFELNNYLVMDVNDKKRKAQKKYSAKSTLLKAIVGAVSVDSKYNMYSIKVVAELLLDIDYYLDNGFDAPNYLLLMENWSKLGGYDRPRYAFNSNSFSYGTNFFQCTCFLSKVNRSFSAKGNNKSSARMNAAKAAYEYLKDNQMLFKLRDVIKEPSLDKAVNQLQELAFKKYISLPEYDLQEIKDPEHEQVWKCKVSVDNISYEAVSLTKRQSKKDAAFKMLNHLMNIEDNI